MTLDMVRYACENAYDEAIVFSGDGDFLKVYDYLINEKGKKVTIFSSMHKESRITNKKIKEATSGILKLNDLGGILPLGSKTDVTL